MQLRNKTMIVSSTSKKPEDMATQEIVQELITATQKSGWDTDFHCVVPLGTGTPLINKCRVFLSRVKEKARSTGKPQRQFKLGSKAVKIQDGQEVVTFYLYQTRVDKIADDACEMLSSINSI